jgi:integrase
MSCKICRFELLVGVLTAFFAQHGRPQIQERAAEKLLTDAVEEVWRAKQDSGLSKPHVASLRSFLREFARAHPAQNLRSLTPETIEQWLDSRGGAAASKASNLGRLGSLFSYSVRKGYITDSPIRRIAPPRLRVRAPMILTPAEARKILVTAQAQAPEILPWVVLGLFAGIRPMEIVDLTWEDVDETDAVVRLTRTKTGLRRCARLEPAALAWLKVCDKTLPLCPSWSTVRRRRKAVFGAWPQDVLRHTAASYLLAKHEDVGKVALWLGNSQRILLRHYHELVGKAACKEFWELYPAGARLATKAEEPAKSPGKSPL